LNASGPNRKAVNAEYLHQELSFAALIDRSFQHPKYFEESSPSVASSRQREPSSDLERAHSAGLPPFLRSLPENLDSARKDYLQATGALQIPPPDFRNEIIDCYLQYIQPHLPVMDPSALVQISDGSLSHEKSPISLLVFQAVLFSAVHLVNIQTLRRAGFKTPRDARRSFYERARVCMTSSQPSETLLTRHEDPIRP
jgi:hypothetical protein